MDATALEGDSGSPAFIYNPENNVYVAGIVWRTARDDSGNFRRVVFSPREQIKNDIVSYSPF